MVPKSNDLFTPHIDLKDYWVDSDDIWHMLGTNVEKYFFEKIFLKSDPRKSLPVEISASEGQKSPKSAKNRVNKKISKSHKTTKNVEKQHLLLSTNFL